MPGGADDRHPLPGGDLEGKVLDHGAALLRVVGERDVLEAYVALDDLGRPSVGAVDDFGLGVEEEEDALRRRRAGGVALEQVAELLERTEEQVDVEQGGRHLTERHLSKHEISRPDHEHRRHSRRGEQAREREEPARSDVALHERPGEVVEQLLIACPVLLLAPGLLQDLHPVHGLHEVRREAAAALGDARPVLARDAVEEPDGWGKDGHNSEDAEEQER